jgi:hypothetical protein
VTVEVLPICLSGHISPGFCRRGNPMEVIDDCTVFFLDILPHTLKHLVSL